MGYATVDFQAGARVAFVIMTYWPIFYVTMAVTTVQAFHERNPSLSSSKEADTIIENKNVNIIVNIDAREVAKELWKVIENRLGNGTARTANTRNTIKDLERAVAPLVSPTRRGGVPPSAHQLANNLDRITRRALIRTSRDRDDIEEEIMTRDIVADMMVSLKLMLESAEQSKVDKMPKEIGTRRMQDSRMEEEDEYVHIGVKIKRMDVVRALRLQ
ncbi:hypothetical protein KM043_017009 [Ampulex compressa]|nr:hypothetical protein KM043_017009 [Ampulex compressa]